MKYVNEAGWDRIVRVIVGLVLMVLTFTGTVSGALGTILMIVGIIVLLTGIIGVCPAYMLFKFRTNKG